MLRNYNKEKLERVADYYLDVSHLPTLRYEAKKQILLAVVSLSGAALFIVPAISYVDNDRDYNRNHYKNLLYRIHFSIGTATTGLAVMYNSTEMFLTTRQTESISAELADILKHPLTLTQKNLKDMSILIGAALSALPMAAVSVAYPLKILPQWMNNIQTTLIEFDNTILHFLPIDLALKVPLYRFPVLPFEYGYAYYKRHSLSKEEKALQEMKEWNESIYQSLKQRIINKLSRTQQSIVLKGFSFEPASLSYSVHLPSDLKQISEKKDTPGLTKLMAIMQYGNLLNPSSFFSSFPRLKQTLGYVDSVLQDLAYAAGAVWVLSSCGGSLAAPYNEGSRLLDSRTEGALAAAPGIYFLSVLLAFFGGNALRDTYHYFTAWGEDQVKIPLEFKLYPKASALLMLFAIYLACFSYGGNCQLAEDNFRGTALDFLLDDLVKLTKGGMPFLSIISMIGFYRTVIKKFALHFGNDEAKMVVQLNLMIERLKTGIQLMKGEDLLAALEELDNEQLGNFGVPSMELSQLKSQLVKKKASDSERTEEKSDTDEESLERKTEETPLLPKPFSRESRESSWCPWLFKSKSSTSPQTNLEVSRLSHGQSVGRRSYFSTTSS